MTSWVWAVVVPPDAFSMKYAVEVDPFPMSGILKYWSSMFASDNFPPAKLPTLAHRFFCVEPDELVKRYPMYPASRTGLTPVSM